MLCVVFRRVGHALRACGSICSLAAASRRHAISPNIIVFVVHGLTFMNVSALDYLVWYTYMTGSVGSPIRCIRAWGEDPILIHIFHTWGYPIPNLSVLGTDPRWPAGGGQRRLPAAAAGGCLLCATAEMSAVSHSRHVCCLTQQTRVLSHMADMSAVSQSRHV